MKKMQMNCSSDLRGPNWLLLVCASMLVFVVMAFFTACSDDNTPSDDGRKYTHVPASLISDPAKLKMLHSIQDLSDGRFFYLDYTVDYKFDLLKNSNITTDRGLIGFVQNYLLDSSKTPANAKWTYGAGCSAFAANTPDGKYIMGRNFDYAHGNEPIAAALVRTAPEGKLRSISLVDGYWIGYRQNLYHSFSTTVEGFNKDKKQDLSYIMGFPYLLMDGMNEAGFAICVLHLDGKPTQQNNTGCKMTTTVLMRYLLDNARSVDEAVKMLNEVDLHVPDGNGNYHFYVADASGKHAVLEYVWDEEHRDAHFIDDEIYDNGGKITGFNFPDVKPNTLHVMTDKHCVSNFYVSPTMECSAKGPTKSQHGKTRYDIMDFVLTQNNDCLTEDRAMSLLNDVSQAENPTDITSHTQWSVVYNLSEKKATVCINRDYNKSFTFYVR